LRIEPDGMKSFLPQFKIGGGKRNPNPKEEAMVYIGCDQHKHFCQLAILNEHGKMIEQKKLYHNDRESLKRYFQSLPKASEMVIEASGFDSWLSDFVENLGIKVHLGHPLKTRAIADAKRSGTVLWGTLWTCPEKVDTLTKGSRIPEEVYRDKKRSPEKIASILTVNLRLKL